MDQKLAKKPRLARACTNRVVSYSETSPCHPATSPRCPPLKKPECEQVQGVLNINNRKKLGRMLRSDSQKHRTMFRRDHHPEWSKYRAFYLVMNEIKCNRPWAEPNDHTLKRRGRIQIEIVPLTGHADDKEVFMAYMVVNENKAVAKYRKRVIVLRGLWQRS